MMKDLRNTAVVLLISAIISVHVAYAGDMHSDGLPPINPSPSSDQATGKIVWHDLATTNIKATQQFYTGLLGWQFKAYGTGENSYYLIRHRGNPVAGLVPLTAKEAVKNDNQWISYLSVADVTHSVQFASANGGKVLLPATERAGQGMLAVLTDPEGALFGVLKSSSGDPPDAHSQPGQWVWADLMVNNPRRSMKFYQGIAGYKLMRDARHPKATEYYLYKNKRPRAGVIPIPGGKHAPKILPNWLPYVYVSNISAAVVKTTKLGGSVILNPATQVYGGKIAIIADPGGAALGLVELAGATK